MIALLALVAWVTAHAVAVGVGVAAVVVTGLAFLRALTGPVTPDPAARGVLPVRPRPRVPWIDVVTPDPAADACQQLAGSGLLNHPQKQSRRSEWYRSIPV